MIKNCTCIHKGQDKLHGKQMRVFNEVKATSNFSHRCTVCLAVVAVKGGK